MKKILTVCINLFILIISEAVAAKLIEGEQTIVKKDGATHTISKYYVVPNDYDPNNNTTKASQTATLRINHHHHHHHSKSMDSGISNKDQVSEDRAENNKKIENNDQVSHNKEANDHISEHNVAVNNTEVSFKSEQNDTQVKVQASDYTAETMESVSTEHNLEGHGLLVEPLTKSININSNVTVDINKTGKTLQNQTRRIKENATESSEANFYNELDDFILTNFRIAVHERATQNIESFWKLVKLYVERISDNTELMARLERLSLLLSIFTNLYQVAQSQKPFESMIDSIIDILQIAYVEKRNTNESQSEIVSGLDDEDLHLASNGINLIELEGQKPSPQLRIANLELDNPDLQERLAGDSNNAYTLSNAYDDRRPDELTDNTEPLPNPYNLKLSAPDGYNVRSTIPPPTRQHAIREKLQEYSKSNQPYFDSSETYEDDLPITIESKFSNNHPLPTEFGVSKQWIVEDKSSESSNPKPWVIEDNSTESRVASNRPVTLLITSSGIYEDQPTIESRFAAGQPLTTASEMAGDRPLTIESRSTGDQPLTNVSGMAEDQPLTTESYMAEDQLLSAESRWAEDQPQTTESRLINDHPSNTDSRTTDDQLLITESKMNEDQPKSTESAMNEDQTLNTESKLHSDHQITTGSGMAEDQPLSVESRLVNDHPLNIELRSADNQPLNTESRVNEDQPLFTESIATDNQPLTTKSRVIKPLIVEDKSTENLPSTVPGLGPDDPRQFEDQMTDNLPWHIEYKTTGKLPWHVEDGMSDKLPWHIEDKTINQAPWTIAHKKTTIPWIIEDRSTKKVPWNIKYNKIGHSPITLYQPNRPDVTTYNGEILLDPNQPSRINGVKNKITKPYHIYTYVIKPKITLNQMPATDIVNVKDEQPNSNLVTKSYSLSSSHGGNKVFYEPISHDSQFSEPATKISNQPGNSQLKHMYNITSTYDTRNEVNPYVLLSDSPQNNNQPKYVVVPGIGSNLKLDLVLPSETQTNSNYDNDISQTILEQPSYISHSEFIIPNEYHNPTVANNGVLGPHPGLMDLVPYHPEITNTAKNYENANPIHDENTDHRPELAHQSEYTNMPDDYDEHIIVSGENTPQRPGYITNTSAHAEVTTSNEYNNPTSAGNEVIDQHSGLIPKVPQKPEYTNELVDYNDRNPVSGEKTSKDPVYVSHSSAHSEFTVPNEYLNPSAANSGIIDQHPVLIHMVSYHPGSTNSADQYEDTEHRPKIAHQSEYINVHDDYDEHIPVYGEKISLDPGYVPHASAHSELTVPNEYLNPSAANSGIIDQHPVLIHMVSYHPGNTNSADQYEDTDHRPELAHQSEYKNVLDDYDEHIPVDGEKTSQHLGHISHASAHSEITIPNEYNNQTATDSEDIDQHPRLIPKIPQQPEYTNERDDYDEPTPVNSEKTPQHLSYISHASAHSEITVPNEYNNKPTPDNEQDIYTHAKSTQNVPHTPEYISVQDHYGQPTPVYEVETVKHPGWKISSHSEYINLPNDYTGDDEDIDTSYSLMQNDLHYLKHKNIQNDDIARPTLVDGAHTGHTIQPSFVAYLHGKQTKKPKELNYLKKVKMPETYLLFTLDNVLKLYDAVIKAIKLSDVDDSDYRALINLRKIIKLILIVAEKLDEPDGRNEWYKKIFLNAEKNRHPLQLYVYKLIRQRWLHELMLILLNNNFDSHILQNPRIFSFLGSWKFPKYVQSFLKAEDLIQNDLDASVADETLKDLQDSFSTNTYDDLVKEKPGGYENYYVTNKVIQSYQVPDDGIVVSIAGVEAEPDAHAIISILQQYLHYKKIIKNQESVINHDNKHEMLKRIALFLKQKGYNPVVISDLIRKLYSAVYLAEGKECQPHHPHFTKNMFDVILPVLRRSGR